MQDDDNGILARINGAYIAGALQQMPDANTTTQQTAEAIFDVPEIGRVRIMARRKRNPRWSGHHFWVAQRADAAPLWTFDDIRAAEPERAAKLEAAPAREEIARLIVPRFEAAMATGDRRIGWQGSQDCRPDSR